MKQRMTRMEVPILLLGLLALLGAACSVQQRSQTAGEAAGQIAPDDINLVGMRLGVDGDGETYHVKGQIENRSQKLTLTELQLKVTLQDCTEDNGCQVLGEQVATVPTEIPAGQSKEFEAQTKFKDLPKAKGTLGWHYSVVAAKAKAS
jgi:hypothetical protein